MNTTRTPHAIQLVAGAKFSRNATERMRALAVVQEYRAPSLFARMVAWLLAPAW